MKCINCKKEMTREEQKHENIHCRECISNFEKQAENRAMSYCRGVVLYE